MESFKSEICFFHLETLFFSLYRGVQRTDKVLHQTEQQNHPKLSISKTDKLEENCNASHLNVAAKMIQFPECGFLTNMFNFAAQSSQHSIKVSGIKDQYHQFSMGPNVNYSHNLLFCCYIMALNNDQDITSLLWMFEYESQTQQ